MNTARSQRSLSRPRWALALLLATLVSSVAVAAGKAGPPDARQRYLRESAACSAIRVPDDRANCLSEASTRFASTQATRAEEQAGILLSNALKRCDPLPAADRQDCVARMQGQGTTRGSVASGGIYRELVTLEVLEAPAAPLPVPEAPPAAAR